MYRLHFYCSMLRRSNGSKLSKLRPSLLIAPAVAPLETVFTNSSIFKGLYILLPCSYKNIYNNIIYINIMPLCIYKVLIIEIFTGAREQDEKRWLWKSMKSAGKWLRQEHQFRFAISISLIWKRKVILRRSKLLIRKDGRN